MMTIGELELKVTYLQRYLRSHSISAKNSDILKQTIDDVFEYFPIATKLGSPLEHRRAGHLEGKIADGPAEIAEILLECLRWLSVEVDENEASPQASRQRR